MSDAITLTPDIDPQLASEATALVVESQALVIQTDAHYVAAVEQLQKIDRAIRKVVTWFTGTDADPGPKALAHRAWRKLCEREAAIVKPLNEERDRIDRAAGDYRREQQRKADEEARQLALRQQAEERERLAREAELLEQQGQLAAAEACLVQAVEAPAPVVIPRAAVPVVSGTSARATWEFRILNEALVPRDYMTPDLKKIGGVVRAMKGATRIPGIEVFDKSRTVTRGA